ncbi:MAG: hypothetical protein NTW96_24690 [Planctomycetia bacterium]|nr:hypothetical protein [Planctomycetia bacterium]
MSRQVKVVAVLGHDRERVMLDEPLTLATLALIQSASPLSKMMLDGAGMAYRPASIAVYLDGVLCWSKTCNRHGSTDEFSSTGHQGDKRVDASSFTDVFPPREDTCSDDYEDCGYGEYFDERRADNRSADDLLHNDYSDPAMDWVEDVIEAAGSLRPIMQPRKPTPVRGNHAPCPIEYAGRMPCCTTPGLPYHKPGEWRRTVTHQYANGVEFCDTIDIEFLTV